MRTLIAFIALILLVTVIATLSLLSIPVAVVPASDIDTQARLYIEDARRVQRGLETFYWETGKGPGSYDEIVLSGRMPGSLAGAVRLPWQLTRSTNLSVVAPVASFELCTQINKVSRLKSFDYSIVCRADPYSRFSLMVRV